VPRAKPQKSPTIDLAQSPVLPQDSWVVPSPSLYIIRIKGRLGPTALSAFPSMVPDLKGGETVLTGLLQDRSAVFGVLSEVEALGLELLEFRQVRPRPDDLA
jgi:hypothetical protein